MDRARRWRRSASAVMAIVAVAVVTARSWNFAASLSQRFFTVLCVADITFSEQYQISRPIAVISIIRTRWRWSSVLSPSIKAQVQSSAGKGRHRLATGLTSHRPTATDPKKTVKSCKIRSTIRWYYYAGCAELSHSDQGSLIA